VFSDKLDVLMADDVKIYQFKIHIKDITPMIWRRFLIKSNSTLKDLHYVIQILMGWTDYHLNEFMIHGCRYTIPNMIGNTSGGGRYGSKIYVSEFKLRKNSKFLYSYDFTAGWEFEIRLEEIDISQENKTYPVCISGSGASPEEECGGPQRFVALKDHWYYKSYKIATDFFVAVADKKNSGKRVEKIFNISVLREAQYWLNINKYERREVNKFLTLYAKGDKRWQEAFDEVIYL
jgi:hypothetical protein